MTAKLARFKRDLGPSDRPKLDEYETDIREIERRLAIAKKATGQVSTDGVVIPAGVPESFDEHVKLHFDLQRLAFQADITRVSTVLYARDLTARRIRKAEYSTASTGSRTTPRIRTTSSATPSSISIT